MLLELLAILISIHPRKPALIKVTIDPIIRSLEGNSLKNKYPTIAAIINSINLNEIKFITEPYAIVPNTTNIISTLCKVSNSSIISANPSWTATPTKIMFDTPIIGNFLTIKPLTSGRTHTGLRVAVVVGPINTFIIKQPKKI